MTEGRTKQTLNAPLPFYGGGIKMYQHGCVHFPYSRFNSVLFELLKGHRHDWGQCLFTKII